MLRCKARENMKNKAYYLYAAMIHVERNPAMAGQMSVLGQPSVNYGAGYSRESSRRPRLRLSS
jgi:hypothetical protein